MNQGNKANRKRLQKREARLPLVSQLYSKGYSYDRIREAVMSQIGLETYSKSTVHKDIHYLLTEWRKERLEDIDSALQLELQKINMQETELWDAWEKSKEDQTLSSKKQKGLIGSSKSVTPKGDLVNKSTIIPSLIEETKKTKINYGDPRYQAEITKISQEKRKLLGLYPPDKREISGNLGFYDFLQEANTVEEE